MSIETGGGVGALKTAHSFGKVRGEGLNLPATNGPVGGGKVEKPYAAKGALKTSHSGGADPQMCGGGACAGEDQMGRGASPRIVGAQSSKNTAPRMITNVVPNSSPAV